MLVLLGSVTPVDNLHHSFAEDLNTAGSSSKYDNVTQNRPPLTIPLGLSLVVLRQLIVVDIVGDVLAEHHDGCPLPVVGACGDLNLLYVETVEEINEEIKIHLLVTSSGQTKSACHLVMINVCTEEDVDTEGPGRSRYLKYDTSRLRSFPPKRSLKPLRPIRLDFLFCISADY